MFSSVIYRFQQLLDSIHYRVERDIRSWKHDNRFLRNTDYGWIHGWVVNASEHPLRVGVQLLALGLLTSIDIHVWEPQLSPSWPEHSRPDLISDLFVAAWTIQATMAALVYPIVIGFIGIILQDRRSTGVRLRLYFRDSGAVLSGLSSLCLLLLMSIHFLALPAVPESVASGWAMFDAIWLCLNVAGTILFIHGTFEFLGPSGRDQVVKLLTVSRLWPTEVRRLLVAHYWHAAQEYKLLPKADDDGGGRNVPRLFLSSLLADDASPEVRRSFRRPSLLTNVWFRPLRSVTRRWLRRAADAGQGRESRFLLPVEPGRLLNGDAVLCMVRGDVRLAWWERLTVCLSLRFGRPEISQAPTATDVLTELQADAMEALRSNQAQRFEESLEALWDLHGTLLRASEFINDAGMPDNYALLGDWRRIQNEWARTYLALFSAAANAIPLDTAFVRTLLYTPTRLYRMEPRVQAPLVNELLISLGRSLMLRVGSW